MILPDNITEKVATYLNLEFGLHGESLIKAEDLTYLGELLIEEQQCHCWGFGDKVYCGTVSEYEGGHMIGIGEIPKSQSVISTL